VYEVINLDKYEIKKRINQNSGALKSGTVINVAITKINIK
jgi:hypothetical protein